MTRHGSADQLATRREPASLRRGELQPKARNRDGVPSPAHDLEMIGGGRLLLVRWAQPGRMGVREPLDDR